MTVVELVPVASTRPAGHHRSTSPDHEDGCSKCLLPNVFKRYVRVFTQMSPDLFSHRFPELDAFETVKTPLIPADYDVAPQSLEQIGLLLRAHYSDRDPSAVPYELHCVTPQPSGRPPDQHDIALLELRPTRAYEHAICRHRAARIASRLLPTQMSRLGQ